MDNPIAIGLETEYAAFSSDGRDVGVVVGELCKAVAKRCPNLPAVEGGVFLANGGRWYVDHGCHPEWATPEVCNPRALVAYDKAGERIMESALKLAFSSHPETFYVVKNNIDYETATYGSHENYSTRERLGDLVDVLIPFLASRVVYAGAGKISWDLRGNGFENSARASHICKRSSKYTTGERGIFCTKDEALADGGMHRLHLLMGDSLLSELGTFLRCGTTALVVRMAECGCLDNVPLLQNPVQDLKLFSLDPGGKRHVAGKHQTALDIQRCYLESARRFLSYNDCPPWGREVVHHWSAVLDALDNEPSLLNRSLDSHIKMLLLAQRLRARQMTWSDVRDWGHLVYELVLPNLETEVIDVGPTGVRDHLREVMPSDAFDEAVAFADTRGLQWSEFQYRRGVIDELKEADIRYHDILRSRGTFYGLEKEGVLGHRVIDERLILKAAHLPPGDTRAHARGTAVQQLQGSPALAHWTYVAKKNAKLDLSDPFSRQGYWRRDDTDSFNDHTREAASSRNRLRELFTGRTLF